MDEEQWEREVLDAMKQYRSFRGAVYGGVNGEHQFWFDRRHQSINSDIAQLRDRWPNAFYTLVF